jgi:hypothetical protein
MRQRASVKVNGLLPDERFPRGSLVPIGTNTANRGENVPYHRHFVSSSRIHCCIFGARLIPLRLAESAGCAAEGFVGRPCYGKFRGSFRQRSGGHLSGSSLRSGRARSRPSRRVPDVKELDHRLQSDHGLAWTLRQPDDRCRERNNDIRRAERPRGKGARHGSFPAHLNEAVERGGNAQHIRHMFNEALLWPNKNQPARYMEDCALLVSRDEAGRDEAGAFCRS